jgi:hypothetical protein
MSHLSPAEFVDAADHLLPPPRAFHLERCERCRTQVADVRRTLEAARSTDVPEPSPLYWQHLSARVHERVAGESIAPAWRADAWSALFGVRALMPIASALALVAAVVVVGEIARPRPLATPAPVTAVAAVTPADTTVVPENSAVWQVLTSAAGEMPMDEAHEAGVGVSGSAIDGAVQRLSPEELAELGRLLQSQLRGSGD